MSKLPIYSEVRDNYRIVSFPGGKWQFQCRTSPAKGVNRGVDEKGKPVAHQDPWEGVRRATDFHTAKTQLLTLVPPVTPT